MHTLKGHTLLELCLALALSLLIVLCALQYYQYHVRHLQHAHQTVEAVLDMAVLTDTLKQDIEAAGYMGCRYLSDALVHDIQDPYVANIFSHVNYQGAFLTTTQDRLLHPLLQSTHYVVLSDQPVLWIQNITTVDPHKPLIEAHCHRLSIQGPTPNAPDTGFWGSMASVVWFIARDAWGVTALYRKDLFGSTYTVARPIDHWRLQATPHAGGTTWAVTIRSRAVDTTIFMSSH